MNTSLLLALSLAFASPLPTETDLSKRDEDRWIQYQDWPGYGIRPDMEAPQPTTQPSFEDEFDAWSGNRIVFTQEHPSFEDEFDAWSGNRITFTQAAEAPEATTTSSADDWYTRFQDWPGYGMRPDMEAPKPTQQPQANGWAWPEK